MLDQAKQAANLTFDSWKLCNDLLCLSHVVPIAHGVAFQHTADVGLHQHPRESAVQCPCTTPAAACSCSRTTLKGSLLGRSDVRRRPTSCCSFTAKL